MSRFDYYPKLPRHEIIGILSESQIANISEVDLLHPDTDFIFNLYTHILLHLDALQDDQGQMEFAALDHIDMDNPEHHGHAVQFLNLYNKVREVLAAVGCPKPFTPKDLIKPETDRLELFLSALLNFCLHRDTRMTLLRPIVDELTEFEERRMASEARISQLQAEIAECEEARERELPLVQEVNSKVNELRQTVSSLNNHQVALKTNIKKLKEKVNEMDEKISEAEFALVQSVQENANLRSKIVQSPDKLQKALDEKKLALNEARSAERAAMISFQEKTGTLEVYTKALKKMAKHHTQMQALQEEMNSAKSVDKEIKALKNKLRDDEVLYKSLNAKLVEMHGKVDQLKELKRQVDTESRHKMEEATKELNNVKLEVESKRWDLERRQKQVEVVVAEADAVNAKINGLKLSGAAKRQEIQHKCEEIVTEFHNYWNKIMEVLPAIEDDKAVA